MTTISEKRNGRTTGSQALLDTIAGKRPGRQPVVLFSAGAWTFNSLGFTDRGYCGYSGGLHLMEDLLGALVAAR